MVDNSHNRQSEGSNVPGVRGVGWVPPTETELPGKPRADSGIASSSSSGSSSPAFPPRSFWRTVLGWLLGITIAASTIEVLQFGLLYVLTFEGALARQPRTIASRREYVNYLTVFALV